MNTKVSSKLKWQVLRLTSIQLMVGSIFTVLAILFCTVFTLIGQSREKIPEVNYKQLMTKGIEGKGEVIALEVNYNTSVNGIHPVVVHFSFLADDKLNYTKVKVLQKNGVDTLKIKDVFPIKYSGGNAVIDGVEPFELPIKYLMIIPMIFGIVGAGLLWFVYSRYSKKLSLYRDGKIGEGKLLKWALVAGMPITNRGQHLSVVFQFSDSRGTKIVVNEKCSDLNLLAQHQEGDSIPIFIDAFGKKACIVPSEFEA